MRVSGCYFPNGIGVILSKNVDFFDDIQMIEELKNDVFMAITERKIKVVQFDLNRAGPLPMIIYNKNSED